MTAFDKPARTADELLALLQDRGLLIPDPARARHCLANISYYRLSAYTRPLQSHSRAMECLDRQR